VVLGGMSFTFVSIISMIFIIILFQEFIVKFDPSASK